MALKLSLGLRRGEERREGGEEGRGGAAECSHLGGGAEERSSIITPTLHPCHDKGERKFLLRPGPGFWRQPQTSRARRSHRRLLLLWHPTRVSKYALHLPCRLGPARSGRHPRSAPQDGQVQHHAGELPVSTHTLRCTQHALPRRQIQVHGHKRVCAPGPELADSDRQARSVPRHRGRRAGARTHPRSGVSRHTAARAGARSDAATAAAPSRTCAGIRHLGG